MAFMSLDCGGAAGEGGEDEQLHEHAGLHGRILVLRAVRRVDSRFIQL